MKSKSKKGFKIKTVVTVVLAVATFESSLAAHTLTLSASASPLAAVHGIEYERAGAEIPLSFSDSTSKVISVNFQGKQVMTIPQSTAGLPELELYEYIADNVEMPVKLASGDARIYDKWDWKKPPEPVVLSSGNKAHKLDYARMVSDIKKGRTAVDVRFTSEQNEYTDDLPGLYKQLIDIFDGDIFTLKFVNLTLPNAPSEFGIRADDCFIAASTYKLFVAYDLLSRIDSGTAGWSSSLDGFTYRNGMEDMMVNSGNPFPEAYGKARGWGRITAAARRLLGGSIKTDLTTGSGNVTTASDLAEALLKLYKGEFASPENSRFLLVLMKKQIHRNRIPAGTNGVVADKTGTYQYNGYSVMNDAGICYTSAGDYVLVILTDHSSEKKMKLAAAAVQSVLGKGLPPGTSADYTAR